MIRYLLSKLIPVPMRSTYSIEISGADVQTGAMPWIDMPGGADVRSVKPGANHFRDDDHHDLVAINWWQWRGRCIRQRTVSTCIGG